jgi:hypothetical protein
MPSYSYDTLIITEMKLTWIVFKSVRYLNNARQKSGLATMSGNQYIIKGSAL